MEIAVSTDVKLGKVRKVRSAQKQNSRSLVRILESFYLEEEGSIDLLACPVEEVSPGKYKGTAERYRLIIKRERLFAAGKKENSFHLLPGSVMILEHDAKDREVALYHPLPKYSEDSRRVVESQEPFYVFEH